MSGEEMRAGFVPVDAVYRDDGVGYAPMSAGDRLLDARKRLNLTLEQASKQTRIRADYLEALETMDPRGLPARAYAIGYLRTYAHFLSLDPGGVVEQFKREVDTETGRAQPTAAAKTREPIKLPKGVFGAVAILAVVAGAAWWYSEQTGGASIGNLPSPPDAAPEWARADFDTSRPAPAIEQIWRDVPLGEDPEDPSVVLRALSPTWLEVRDASGRILFSRRLEGGETYRMREPGLTVSAANAGAILIEQDGAEVGPLGNIGVAVENLEVLAQLEATQLGNAPEVQPQ
ncbi:helix-turn-helix domain-containing protein [Maricaulis sp. CAU 1757]